jgi:subtilase family serine protease
MHVALPDLELRLPLVMPDSPAAGDTYVVNLNVWNRGATAAPASSIAVTAVDGGGTAVFTGTLSVPALSAGGGTTVAVDFGRQGVLGVRHVSAIVNPDTVFAEGNTENNVVHFDYLVAGPADLVIQPADIAFSPNPPTLYQGLDVTVRVRNTGGAVAHNVHVQLFQGLPTAGGTLVSESYLNAVAPGVPRTMTGRLVPSSLDPLLLFARVDPENAVVETDKTNNSASVSAKPVRPADIVVDLAALLNSGTSTTVHQGDTLTVNYGIQASVQRFGGGYDFTEFWTFPGATAVLYQVVSGAPVEIERHYFASLNLANGPNTTGITYSTNGWADGTYQYTVVADPLNEVPDTNRANNTKTISVTVQTDNVAELWMDGVSADPPQVSPGGAVVQHGLLHNSGKVTATNIPVRIQAGGTVTNVTIPQLAPGASVDVRNAITASTTPGAYDFYFTIDPGMTIPESSKTNNTASGRYQVLGSDLQVVSLVVSPDPFPTGQAASVTLQLKNVGVTAGPYISVSLDWTPVGQATQVIGTLYTTSYPAPGATSTFTIPIVTKGIVGQVDARLFVLPTGLLQTFPLRALNPDFAVTSSAISFMPGHPSPGDVVTPQVVVNNLGTLTAPTSVRIYRGYAENKDLASSGTVTVPAGGSATFVGPSFTLQQAPPFVVTVVLDEEDAYPEPNENNNRAVRNVIKADGEVIVAFDQTHEQLMTIPSSAAYPEAGYPDWASDLGARGYVVKSINPGPDGFAARQLLGVDVVVNAVPMSKYTPAELAVWSDFLRGGGGVLFIGEWGSDVSPPVWQDPEDDFLKILGITSAHVSVGPVFASFLHYPSTNYGLILDHPITTGVQGVEGNLTGGFSQLPQGAQPLLVSGALTPSGVTVAAAFEREGGRVVVAGDSQFFDSGIHTAPSGLGKAVVYISEDNRRFGLQIIDWLVNGGPHDYLADLAFVPASLQASITSPIVGDVVSFTTTVRNVGGAFEPSAGAVVRLYDGDPVTGQVIGEQALEDLGVDLEQPVTFTWNTRGASGDHVLTAVIDPDLRLNEQTRVNNTVTSAVTVRAANDLRIDPSDVMPSRDGSHVLAVTVHNVGYLDVAAGTRLLVTEQVSGGTKTIGSVHLGVVPARGLLTTTLPWPDFDPTQQHTVTVVGDAEQQLPDPTRDDDTASATFAPPTLKITAPLPGTRWGGTKDVTWAGASAERLDPTFDVAIASDGGAYTGLGRTSGQVFSLDTRAYPDGMYRIRVTESDGLLATVQEVPFTISNGGQSVRFFGAGGGTANVSIPATGGAAQIAVPVNSRVSSATMAVTPSPSPGSIASGFWSGTPVGLFEVKDALWLFSIESGSSGVTFGYRTSIDGGATWSGRTNLATYGLVDLRASVLHTSSGFHATYYQAGFGSQSYVSSRDGTTWTSPVTVPQGTFAGSDDGLLLVQPSGLATISQGSADGSSWAAAQAISGVINQGGIRATVAAGNIHLVGWDSSSLRYFRSPWGADTSLASSVSTALTLDTTGVIDANLVTSNGSLFLAYSTNRSGPGLQVWVQRCDLSRDCTKRDSWLPAPVFIGVGSGVQLGSQRPDLVGVAWYYGHNDWQVSGLEGGKRFGLANANSMLTLGYQNWLFGKDYLGIAGVGQNSTLIYDRNPGLTPIDLAIDVGGKGTPDLSQPGMLGSTSQVPDFAAAINAYLASHSDGDDGAVDGLIQVPVAITSHGVGQTTLRNLEVSYQPLSQLAGFAEPPVFSPGTSPGIVDTSALSVTGAGPIAVMTSAGTVVRTLTTTIASARYMASFDGRDDAGTLLPSGLYSFGSPGWPVGNVEIDNMLPTAVLRAGTDGNYGGVVSVDGIATDSDFAGTAKNFCRYVLDYTLDGTSYSTIAVGTAPIDGVLGRWDTRKLGVGSATLRLTAYDKAGNSASTARTLSVSPGAPAAPVITGPTVAGNPIDTLASSVVLTGAAEPNTTVTVYLGGIAIGTSPSNGTWSLAGVVLPAGISTITASASSGGIEGPRSKPVVIARYDLGLAVSVSPHVASGSTVNGTVTLTRTSVNATPLQVHLSAKDSAGQMAADLVLTPSDTTLAVAGAVTMSYSFTLATGIALPGSYTVRAEVVSGGLLPAAGEVPVSVDALVNLNASLVTDKASYDATETVALAGRVFARGNGLGTGALQATVAIMSPSGRVSVLGPVDVAAIPVGQVAALAWLYGTPPLDVGDYTASMSVTDGTGAVVATAATGFTIQLANGAGELTGTMSVTPTTYLRGEVLSAAFAVSNQGSDATVPVSVLLISQATSAVVARSDQMMTLAHGATAKATVQLSTSSADGNELIAVLVGNGRGLAGQAIAPSPIRDTDPPVITIAGFDDGEYRNGSVTPVVTITDASSFTSEVKLNGKPFASGTQVTIDASYDLVVTAVDAYGNSSRAEKTFTIDTTPPQIQVQGVYAGEMSKVPLTPTVSISDSHLRNRTLLLDGQPFQSGSTITQEGDHVLSASADDLAGNTANVQVSFTIDQVPPLIEISGVVDGELTKDTVFASVKVTESHPGAETVLLDGITWNGLPITNEGDHVLGVQAMDEAGNTASSVVHFTVDKTSPTIVIAGVSDGALLNQAVKPTVTVTDLHSPTYTVSLDGTSWNGQAIGGEGTHVFLVTAQDGAGNRSSKSVTLTVDATPPVIAVAGVTSGLVTKQSVTPVITVTDLHGPSYLATVDTKPYSSGTPVTAEGEHDLTVHSSDAAGNTSDKALHFAIDRTPPTITVTGVSDGQVASGPVTPVITIQDAHPGTQTIVLDGKTFVSGTTVSGAGQHTLAVTATDAAGNNAAVQTAFTIRSAQATLTAAFDSTPRVLIGLDCKSGGSCGSHSGGGCSSSAGNCKNDSCAGKVAFLLDTLQQAHIPFDVAENSSDFLELLRAHRHTVRVLYEFSSSEDEPSEELREATFAGGGLVVVNASPPDNDPKLADVLGATTLGFVRYLGNVSFASGELGASRTLPLLGTGASQRLVGATAVGKAGSNVVLSTQHYGSGRAALVTFDPQANSTTAGMADLLLSLVRFASSGSRPQPVAGAPQYLTFGTQLLSQGPANMQLATAMPQGLSVVDAPQAASKSPPTWNFTLSTNQAESFSLVVTGSSAGTYPIDSILYFSTSQGRVPAATASVDVSLPLSTVTLQAQAIAAVKALSASSCDKQRRDRALQYLAAIHMPATCALGAEQNIQYALEVIEEVRAMSSSGVDATRLQLDALLRACEIASLAFQPVH